MCFILKNILYNILSSSSYWHYNLSRGGGGLPISYRVSATLKGLLLKFLKLFLKSEMLLFPNRVRRTTAVHKSLRNHSYVLLNSQVNEISQKFIRSNLSKEYLFIISTIRIFKMCRG